MSADRSLLIDTDTATDDAIALLLAAHSDRISIDLVTTVAGNVPVERATANAAYTLDLVDADVPIAAGAPKPLVRHLETAEDVHGAGGLGGDLRPAPPASIDDRSAPAAIIDAARNRPGEVTLVCLGPLTNLARALARDPGIASGFESIWLMGGAVTAPGNVTPVAEYNFYVDPDAAARVIEVVDATLVDWGLAGRAGVLTGSMIDRIVERSDRTPSAAFFETIIPAVRSFSMANETEDGVVLADALAMALLLEPNLIEAVTTRPLSVDAREGPTRGLSHVSEDPARRGGGRITVIEEADATGFNRLLQDALVRSDPHARRSG